ncbi:hypothetical protein ACFQZ2_18615 [Streptomonospora algeriensis]|uniref:Uncharacterized protein n=1 Tax=Streptomonospora algeriensis TaxID=995084 RepID=A0ABW3BB98_9ACTN
MSTIAIDFDGVIHDYDKGWHDGSIYGDFRPGAMETLLWLLRPRSPYTVFVHTTRSPRQVAQWIDQQSGHYIECVTRMHPLVPAWWQWGKRFTFWNTTGLLLVTNRKLPAIAYIDDRAVRFESWAQVSRDMTALGYSFGMPDTGVPGE